MSHTPFYAALITLFLVSSSSASERVVQLGCERSPNFAEPFAFDNPFAVLVQATKKDAHASLFRVSWRDSLGSSWDEGTMLYDRRQAQLCYFDQGGAGEAGEEFYLKNYLFLKIDDAALRGLLRFNTPGRIRELLPDSFTITLPRLGHPTRKLKEFKKGCR